MTTDNSEFVEVVYHAARRCGGATGQRWTRYAAPGDLNELLLGALPAAGGLSK